MEKDTTPNEILEAINAFSTKMDGRLDKMDGRLDKMDGRLDNLEKDVAGIKATLTTMPTRDDMDEKLTDMKGDIIVTIRKGDVKLHMLVDILHENKILTDPQVRRILSLEPFPQLFL